MAESINILQRGLIRQYNKYTVNMNIRPLLWLQFLGRPDNTRSYLPIALFTQRCELVRIHVDASGPPLNQHHSDPAEHTWAEHTWAEHTWAEHTWAEHTWAEHTWAELNGGDHFPETHE